MKTHLKIGKPRKVLWLLAFEHVAFEQGGGRAGAMRPARSGEAGPGSAAALAPSPRGSRGLSQEDWAPSQRGSRGPSPGGWAPSAGPFPRGAHQSLGAALQPGPAPGVAPPRFNC